MNSEGFIEGLFDKGGDKVRAKGKARIYKTISEARVE